MSKINLDELLAQRAEATGSKEGRIEFEFAGKTWSFRDQLALTDEDKEELDELSFDADVAAWYMGDDQYDKFLEAGGSSNLFFIAFREHMQREQEELEEGKFSRSNRSQRRSAARKRAKRH